MILHADSNSFYASCEQIFRPDLRGEPYFKVKEFCYLRGISVFSSNYTLYADISKRITSIYREFAPDIEEYSIDESFLFFDKCNWTLKEYEEIGRDLKARIYLECFC